MDETQIGAQRDVAPMLIFAPFRSAPFPLGLFLGPRLRGVGGRFLQLFHHDRVVGATFDTDEGDTQKIQSRDDFPIQGGKKPVSSIRLLARFRHHHVITAYQDHIIGLSQMVPNQYPLQRSPTYAGGEQTLDRPVTAPFASPARHAPHRHASGHREHRFSHPAEVAQRGGIETLA